ncbi:MAG: hypothetical protein U0531_10290 [Dehalococcoidia bacterium]
MNSCGGVGTAGSLGQGGAGKSAVCLGDDGGGGGGGGLYGGGGGGPGVRGGGGGGGSGFAPAGGTMTSGVRAGDGLVVIVLPFDLTVSKSCTPTPTVATGQTLSCTLTVTNAAGSLGDAYLPQGTVLLRDALTVTGGTFTPTVTPPGRLHLRRHDDHRLHPHRPSGGHPAARRHARLHPERHGEPDKRLHQRHGDREPYLRHQRRPRRRRGGDGLRHQHGRPGERGRGGAGPDGEQELHAHRNRDGGTTL